MPASNVQQYYIELHKLIAEHSSVGPIAAAIMLPPKISFKSDIVEPVNPLLASLITVNNNLVKAAIRITTQIGEFALNIMPSAISERPILAFGVMGLSGFLLVRFIGLAALGHPLVAAGAVALSGALVGAYYFKDKISGFFNRKPVDASVDFRSAAISQLGKPRKLSRSQSANNLLDNSKPVQTPRHTLNQP